MQQDDRVHIVFAVSGRAKQLVQCGQGCRQLHVPQRNAAHRERVRPLPAPVGRERHAPRIDLPQRGLVHLPAGRPVCDRRLPENRLVAFSAPGHLPYGPGRVTTANVVLPDVVVPGVDAGRLSSAALNNAGDPTLARFQGPEVASGIAEA